MLEQIYSTDPRIINAAIEDYHQQRGSKVVAIIPNFGTVEVLAARQEDGRLQVQFERLGQWHNPQPAACFKDVP